MSDLNEPNERSILSRAGTNLLPNVACFELVFSCICSFLHLSPNTLQARHYPVNSGQKNGGRLTIGLVESIYISSRFIFSPFM